MRIRITAAQYQNIETTSKIKVVWHLATKSYEVAVTWAWRLAGF